MQPSIEGIMLPSYTISTELVDSAWVGRGVETMVFVCLVFARVKAGLE